MADVDWFLLRKDHNQPSLHELSDLISIKEFKEKVTRVHRTVCAEGLQGVPDKDIQDKMNVSDDVFEKSYFFPSPKPSGTDGKNSEPILIMDEGMSVNILQRTTRSMIPSDTGLETMNNLGLCDSIFSQSGFFPAPSMILPRMQDVFPKDLVSCPEIVLSIIVYHPILRRPNIEYLVLGCQLLSELKDLLFCPRDYHVTTDYSDNHNRISSHCVKQPAIKSKSGYFFINNTFYNDTRQIDAEDYSENVIQWVESCQERLAKSPRLDHFKKGKMESTKFEDLSLRLGYPYLYCHHGNCEHGIVFTDLRLFNSSDVQDKSKYPLFTRYWKTHRKRCCVCEEFTANWATVNDEMAMETPAFFCNDCFDLLHYTSDGGKVGDFKAYPYYDEVTALLDANAPTLDQS